VRAYNENGIAIHDFDSFGPTARTLRQFIEACHQLEGQVRNIMIPNPD
jgi:transaldolase